MRPRHPVRTAALHPRPDHHVRKGIGRCTRSILPDVDHFGLMRHNGRILPDGMYSRHDELDRLVSEGFRGCGESLTFSSYSCITSAAMISLSLTNIWKALVSVDTFETKLGKNHGAESYRRARSPEPTQAA